MKKIILYTILFFGLIANVYSQNIVKKDGKYVDEKNEPFTGVYKEYYDNGQLKSEISLSNGLLDDKSYFYHKDGSKKEIRAYRDGKMHDKWISWSSTVATGIV